VLALYQALNAIQIAQATGAEKSAPDVMRKAEQLYNQARNAQIQSNDPKYVTSLAREAAQIAEDARTITAKQNSK
jgi:hypothetical protein